MRILIAGMLAVSVLMGAVAHAYPEREEVHRFEAQRHMHGLRPTANAQLEGGAPEAGARELRGEAGNKASTGTSSASPDMRFHGGTVMNHLSVRVLFAGPKWATPSFANDKITGIDAFFGGYGGSAYAASADEYVGANGEVGSSLTYQGHESPSAASASVDGTNMSTVITAVCTEASSPKFLWATGSQMIVVYTDKPRPATANYCGYHGTMTCAGQPLQYAFMWSMDGDSGCNAQDPLTGHSQGLSSLVNVTAHEVAETRTDPQLSSWYDVNGNENGDKCAWTFKHSYVTLKNGTKWKVQTEWSNAAYDAGTGYPALGGGYKGCVDGQ